MSEVKLFWANVSVMTTNDLIWALNLVSSRRAEKTMRFRNESDRKLSVCAELLLQKAIGKNEISFTYGENEKPYIEDGPYFNISHSGDISLCAVADCEIGCDIEKIKDYNEKIARRFFTENEKNWIEGHNDKAEAFFRVWTLKEAFVKATGLGMEQPFADFSVVDGDNIALAENPEEYLLKEVNVRDGYKCSICTRYSEINGVTIKEISVPNLIGGSYDL